MKKKINFEEGMQELETLVRELESGQMPLDESFKAYERAIKIRDSLKALLEESDRKIRILTEAGEREMKEEDEQ